MTNTQKQFLKEFLDAWFEGTYFLGENIIIFEKASFADQFLKEFRAEDVNLNSYKFSIEGNKVMLGDLGNDADRLYSIFEINRERKTKMETKVLGTLNPSLDNVLISEIPQLFEEALNKFPPKAYVMETNHCGGSPEWTVCIKKPVSETNMEVVERLKTEAKNRRQTATEKANLILFGEKI